MKNYTSYKDLQVWKSSMKLIQDIYQISASFPDSEKFGITSQIRRASISIANNIAEGKGRLSRLQFRYFLNIARGSACEVSNLLEICKNLKLISQEQFDHLDKETDRISAMLYNLYFHLK